MLTKDHIEGLPADRRREVEEALLALERLKQDDPLQFFHACPEDCGVPGCVPHPEQHKFLVAKTKTQAVFAGNRFGKTTALVVKCLVQHYPKDQLPERLKPYRFVEHDRPVRGRFMCPNADALNGYVLPKMQEWVPKHLLLGGNWAKAYSKQHAVLLFADGGQIEFRTYMVEPATLVGADLDYVANDEPSPEAHAKENWYRLIDRKGKMIHALTPVNMTGGGIGWLYRDVYKRREDPNTTVVMGAIHDNKHLDANEVALTLANATEKEREAREFGRFIHMGGMIYPSGFERVLCDPPSADHLKGMEIVVGIDPGLKNASFVWVAFDEDNCALVFDHIRLCEKTPADYARAIRRVNQKWGLRNPLYVIDPSARNRSLVNRESVQAELQRHGIPCVPGQNQVEAGVQQIRRRMESKMLLVSRDPDPDGCRVLRDEAEEYRMADRADGEFKVVKEKDHALDAMRYACMSRPFYPWPKSEQKPLGWDITTDTVAHASQWMRGGNTTVGPLGSWA